MLCAACCGALQLHAAARLPLPAAAHASNWLQPAHQPCTRSACLANLDVPNPHSTLLCSTHTHFAAQTLASSLAAAVDSGLAKSVGVSNFSEAEMRETHRVLAERGIPLAVNQVGAALVLGWDQRVVARIACLQQQ